jgi:NADH-quinone oxidoreductase subunit M
MFGKVTKPENEKLKDLNAREVIILIPMVILIFLMGIYPKLFISKMDVTVEKFLQDVRGRAGVQTQAEVVQPEVVSVQQSMQNVKWSVQNAKYETEDQKAK